MSRRMAVVLMAGFAAETAYWSTGDGRPPVTFRGLLGPPQHDETIAPWDAQLSILAAGDRATVEWFDTGHLFDDAARASREAWLAPTITAP